jgi:sugar O-acyltransferase (sialic acid O-acetyltransferase NeuD family)
MVSCDAARSAGMISDKSEEIVVIGGGGHAKVVVAILRKLEKYSIKGYTDLKDRGDLSGVSYLGTDSDFVNSANLRRENAALAVGQVGLGKVRCEIWSRIASKGMIFPAIVSPNSIVNEGVAIDEGVLVMDGSVVNSGAKLGRGVIANTHCTIEHDVILAEWVHLGPGATVCGDVTIGRFSMIGAGATVIEGKSIASEIIIGAGATVVDDLLEPGIYVGTPARRIK